MQTGQVQLGAGLLDLRTSLQVRSLVERVVDVLDQEDEGLPALRLLGQPLHPPELPLREAEAKFDNVLDATDDRASRDGGDRFPAHAGNL